MSERARVCVFGGRYLQTTRYYILEVRINIVGKPILLKKNVIMYEEVEVNIGFGIGDLGFESRIRCGSRMGIWDSNPQSAAISGLGIQNW
jgi:hypothetical protein